MATENRILVTRAREELGSAAARRLRRAGELPGLLAGLGERPLPIALGRHEFELAHQAGARIVTLDLGREKVEVLIREIQWDALGSDVLHVDFDRVDRAQAIEVEIPIVTFGEAPGVAAGGDLEVLVGSVKVTCLPGSIPENLEVDVTALEVGEEVRLKDVPIPDGVEASLDGEEVVVRVTVPVEEEEEEEEVLGEEASSEPEVIGKGKEEKAEEEGAD